MPLAAWWMSKASLAKAFQKPRQDNQIMRELKVKVSAGR
jgi:hypothetical protein